MHCSSPFLLPMALGLKNTSAQDLVLKNSQGICDCEWHLSWLLIMNLPMEGGNAKSGSLWW